MARTRAGEAGGAMMASQNKAKATLVERHREEFDQLVSQYMVERGFARVERIEVVWELEKE